MRQPTIRKFLRRARNAAQRGAYRLRDCTLPTFEPTHSEAELARLVPPGLVFEPAAADFAAVSLYLEHRFDLLGSGWVKVRSGMRCRGFDGVALSSMAASGQNRRNAAQCARIAALISTTYERIDWQLDFRSGYRWSERNWYRDIRYGQVPGADVKVPWELSRMQHLPDLALVYAATGDQRLPAELRNQLLDWMANNPPRFGVNWACTMDVGIRVANWLLAFDLMRAAGARFDAPFLRQLHASVVAHGEHILRNLEWTETRRANHYLGNIAGLVFAAAYLPADERSDAWLAFGIQELAAESAYQFLPDGAHFEASSAYHGLCAEMLAVCAVLLETLPNARIAALLERSPVRLTSGPGLRDDTVARMRDEYRRCGRLLPAEFYARLHAAARFAHDLGRDDGSVPLIGDDDSAHFVRLGGWLDGGSVAECRGRFANLAGFDELPAEVRYPLQPAGTQQAWLAWESVLQGSTDFLNPHARPVAWEHHRRLALALAPKSSTSAVQAMPVPPVREARIPQVEPIVVVESQEFPGPDLLEGARHVAYPWFGVYVLRSRRMHLVVRCGDALRDGAGVHAHEDQLAMDLTVDGVAVCSDPGTFVYTASPALRAQYRAATAHCAPVAVGEAQRRPVSPFASPEVSYAQCRRFDGGCFEGVAELPGGAVTRRIQVTSQRLEVRDEYRLRPGWKPAAGSVFSSSQPVAFSPAYGVQLVVEE